MDKKKVVITGMGAITGLGVGVDENWLNLCKGVNSVSDITLFDTSEYKTKFASQVRDFSHSSLFKPKDCKKHDRFIHFGIEACKEAVLDAGIDDSMDKDRIGICVGSGIGGLEVIGNNVSKILSSPRKASAFFVSGSIVNMVAGNISILFGYRGPNIAISTACSTGTHSIGMGARMISSGDADIMICGGAEAPICSLGVAGFNACRALSTRNEDCKTASRPWDTGRDGFVLGEGAGILVLESEESAKKRGAKIYAEVAGFGMSSDAHHITMPHPEGKGAALSMNNALRDAGISADKIDYINAHGTSTPAGDLLEINAVKKVMGESVYDVAISSSKSMIGHLLGAAGAVEAIYSIKAINTNTVPPTINLNNVESACDGINLVPDSKQNKEVEYSMSNSFGFGGTNGTLIFKSTT